MSAAGRSIGAGLGIVLDQVLGEPGVEPHPVAAFGSLMERVETRWWADSRARGGGQLAAGLAVGLGAGLPLPGGLVGTAGATYVSVAGHGLVDAARRIGTVLEAGDLEAARAALPSLVGRDPRGLDAADIARAVVESVAENTVDAVVAPALWGALAGPSGTLAYRAVNTLDAMVGYRSERYERYGWASARADDLANLVPARVTALLVAACRPSKAGAVRTIVTRDARHHPSPNAGVAEAAFAAALGLQLGGTNRYGEQVEQRALLGDGPPPGPADIDRACHLSRDVAGALAAALGVIGMLGMVRRRRA
jgi:adenosylcobinamide-phosphate synthase